MSASDTKWLHIWEFLSTTGFLLVIVGCIIEGVEHFWRFKRGENPKKHLIEKTGWFILIAGLALEFLADKKAKRISDRENVRLAQEAADGRRLAAEANERAAIP